MQALDKRAQRRPGRRVVRHKGKGAPGGAGRREADAAMALGTEERQDSLRDMHMSEEVDFEHVVNKCITILKLDFQF